MKYTVRQRSTFTNISGLTTSLPVISQVDNDELILEFLLFDVLLLLFFFLVRSRILM